MVAQFLCNPAQSHAIFIGHMTTFVPRPQTETAMMALSHLYRFSSLFSRHSPHLPPLCGVCRQSSALASLREILGSELTAIRDAGTFKHERVITSPQAAEITVHKRAGSLLNFCANNYLGLSVSINNMRGISNVLITAPP